MKILQTLWRFAFGLPATKKPVPVMAEPKAKPIADTGKLKTWRWDSHKATAHTKSEARAKFKAKLGLKRLPIGANVVAV